MNRNEKGQFLKGTEKTFEGLGIYHDKKGYACIFFNGKNIKLHVYIWERANGKKPGGCDIHHIDENKGNYSLANLQLVTHSDHQKIHAGWVMVNDEWVSKPCAGCKKILELNQFYPRKGKTPSALCKPCHNRKTAAFNASPEKKAKLKIYKHEYYLKHRAEVSGVMPNA